MSLTTISDAIKTTKKFKLSRKLIVRILLLLFVPLVIAGSSVGYKYYKADNFLKQCEKSYSSREYLLASHTCEKSVTYWFRQDIKDKGVKAMILYRSHSNYLVGLDAYSNQQWENVIKFLTKVDTADADYADAVEKLASAKKELAEKNSSKKVAGAEDNTNSNGSSIVYVPAQTSKKSTTPAKISTSTQNKINALEDKLKKLSKTTTPSPPDNPTLSLSNSQISAVVQIICLNKDFTDYMPKLGSGTIYSSKGYIYTNRHVIEQQDGSVAFTFCAIAVTDDIAKPPVFKYFAQLDSYSSSTDVADLSIWWDIDGNDLPSSKVFPSISIGSSSSMSPGDPVWVAGYPDYGGNTWTLTEGIISGWVGGILKTDAQISYGNSGGAALNKNKQLIGIPTWVGSGGGGSLGYIITIDEVTSLTDWIYLY